MTTATASPAMAFAMEALRLNPDASYADLKARAEMEGVTLIPVVYGRAKLRLGLVKPKPKPVEKVAEWVDEEPPEMVVRLGEGLEQAVAGEAMAAEEAAVPVETAPPRTRAPRRAARSSSSVEQPLQQLLTYIQELEAENRRLRDGLQQILAAVVSGLE